jgi:hypothetical protein
MTHPRKNRSLLGEFFHFLKAERKWWLLPLLAVFLLIGVLALLGEVYPALAPFIYPFY